MRFLRLFKRSLFVIIFISGLFLAVWLAFIAKPAPELISYAEAADLAKNKEVEKLPPTVIPNTRAASLPATPPSNAESTASLNTHITSSKLIIPVLGIRPDQLYDSFADSRSEGRSHCALDIPAQKGTPVIAAADGVIKRFFYSERGGKTLYQLGADGKTVYYYAHLNDYANAMAEGRAVKQGEVIAYVGDTGNAGAGNYHLHFAIWTVTDPKRIWQGNNINPYPLLR